MTREDFIKIIEAEIKWCRENEHQVKEIYSQDYIDGFIKGLEQAKILVEISGLSTATKEAK